VQESVEAKLACNTEVKYGIATVNQEKLSKTVEIHGKGIT